VLNNCFRCRACTNGTAKDLSGPMRIVDAEAYCDRRTLNVVYRDHSKILFTRSFKIYSTKI